MQWCISQERWAAVRDRLLEENIGDDNVINGLKLCIEELTEQLFSDDSLVAVESPMTPQAEEAAPPPLQAIPIELVEREEKERKGSRLASRHASVERHRELSGRAPSRHSSSGVHVHQQAAAPPKRLSPVDSNKSAAASPRITQDTATQVETVRGNVSIHIFQKVVYRTQLRQMQKLFGRQSALVESLCRDLLHVVGICATDRKTWKEWIAQHVSDASTLVLSQVLTSWRRLSRSDKITEATRQLMVNLSHPRQVIENTTVSPLFLCRNCLRDGRNEYSYYDNRSHRFEQLVPVPPKGDKDRKQRKGSPDEKLPQIDWLAGHGSKAWSSEINHGGNLVPLPPAPQETRSPRLPLVYRAGEIPPLCKWPKWISSNPQRFRQ
jgi:hypothetical protein